MSSAANILDDAQIDLCEAQMRLVQVDDCALSLMKAKTKELALEAIARAKLTINRAEKLIEEELYECE